MSSSPLQQLFKNYCDAADKLLVAASVKPKSISVFQNVPSVMGDLNFATHLENAKEKSGSREELAVSVAVVAIMECIRGILHDAGVPQHHDVAAMAAVNGAFDDPIFQRWERIPPNEILQAELPQNRQATAGAKDGEAAEGRVFVDAQWTKEATLQVSARGCPAPLSARRCPTPLSARRAPLRPALPRPPLRSALPRAPLRSALPRTPLRPALRHAPLRSALRHAPGAGGRRPLALGAALPPPAA